MATQALAVTNPDEWAEAVMKWRGARCVLSSRFSTNVGALYRDFSDWSEEQNDWPCDREQFLTLIQQTKTRLYSVGELILASGIGLAADVEAAKKMCYGSIDSPRKQPLRVWGVNSF